jgi:hypothetical protein
MHECFRGGLKTPNIVQEAVSEATILSLVAWRSMTLRAGCSFVDTFGVVPLPDPRSLQPSMFDVSANHLDRVLARASFPDCCPYPSAKPRLGLMDPVIQ